MAPPPGWMGDSPNWPFMCDALLLLWFSQGILAPLASCGDVRLATAPATDA